MGGYKSLELVMMHLRARLRRIDRVLRLWWLLPILAGLVLRWVHSPPTRPYDGRQGGSGVGEG